VKDVASVIDIFPTFVSMLGADLDPMLPGTSLFELAPRGQSGRHVFLHLDRIGADNDYAHIRAVLSKEWKYISDDHLGRRFLFNLRTDPGEQLNRIEHATRTREQLEEQHSRFESLTRDERPGTIPVDIDEELLKRLRELGYVD
jgi:arylsulfatase A-like enzyme